MRYRVLFTFICSVLTHWTCQAVAQDADSPEAQADEQQAQEAVAPPEPQLFEFETAGFDFRDSGVVSAQVGGTTK